MHLGTPGCNERITGGSGERHGTRAAAAKGRAGPPVHRSPHTPDLAVGRARCTGCIPRPRHVRSAAARSCRPLRGTPTRPSCPEPRTCPSRYCGRRPVGRSWPGPPGTCCTGDLTRPAITNPGNSLSGSRLTLRYSAGLKLALYQFWTPTSRCGTGSSFSCRSANHDEI